MKYDGKAEMHIDANSFVRPTGEGTTAATAVIPSEP